MTEFISDPTTSDDAVHTLRQFAALSGPFDPVQALRTLGDGTQFDPLELAGVASDLARACERTMIGDAELWLMRGSERRQELNVLARSLDPVSAVADAVEQRRSELDEDARRDDPTRDLLAALAGEGRFSAAGVSELLDRERDPNALERVAAALERAGPLAPQYERLAELHAAVAGASIRERLTAGEARDFFGRQAELATIDAWLNRTHGSGRVQALYVDGLPGIGKSALLEHVVRPSALAPERWVIARFDFDRAGLDVLDWNGLSIELARQIAAQAPSHAPDLEAARRSAASTVPGVQGLSVESKRYVPTDLGTAIVQAMGAAGRTVLVLLDTAEVLRARGETHPRQFFDWLDQVSGFRVPVVVVAAGRGNALDPISERVVETVSLTGLADDAADQLLTELGVNPGDFSAVRTVAHGNPLALRLAAKVALEGDARSLALVEEGDAGFTAAYLYRFILSRIDGDLRILANPGLIVRKINPEVIQQVIGPNVGLDELTVEAAQDMFDTLAGQHWLVEPDPDAIGFVRHRSDMRAALLPLLYRTKNPKPATIDRAAAAWFGRRTEWWSAIESAYHRLQLMRTDRSVPTLDPDILRQFDSATLNELPDAARDLVLRSGGERSSAYRDDFIHERGRPVDEGAVQDLKLIIDRADWAEGSYLYERAFAGAGFDVRSPAADTARTFLWRSGRWAQARRLLLERDRSGGDDSDLVAMISESPQDAACRLEMRAEFAFDQLVNSLRASADLTGGVRALISRGVRSSLGAGPLRLALQVVGQFPEKGPSEIDPTSAAAAWWQGDTDDRAPGPRLEESAGWSRISTRIGTTGSPGSGIATRARCLAALSPYGELASTAMGQGRRQRAAKLFDDAYERLERVGLLAPEGVGAWHDNRPPASGSTERLQAFGDVGLLAEALGAVAYVLRDADLTLMASAAERWRRTMAGRWSYGGRATSHPAGWWLPIDVSLGDRIEVLRASPNPVESSFAQLDAWCAPEEGGSALNRFGRRSPKTLDEAAHRGSSGNRAQLAARLLARRGVPAAFVPAFAVLMENRAVPETPAEKGTDHD